MCNGERGHRHLGALRILYQQQPTEVDRLFIQIRQWLTVDGEQSDLVVEQGLLEDGELQTESIVAPFHLTAEQALEGVNGQTRQ